MCYLVGVEFGKTPSWVYRNLSFRQIVGFLEISNWFKRKASGSSINAEDQAMMDRAMKDFENMYGPPGSGLY